MLWGGIGAGGNLSAMRSLEHTAGLKDKRVIAFVCCCMLLVFSIPSQADLEGEILSLLGANWLGDLYTEGGLDAGLPGDADTLVASADGFAGYPQKASLIVNLTLDYSRSVLVELTVGYRTNSMQTRVGTLLWDGQPILTCNAYAPTEQLQVKKVLLTTLDFSFAQGPHRLEIQAKDDPANDWDLFEVDAIGIHLIGCWHEPIQIQHDWIIVCGEDASTAETENILKLKSELSALISGNVGIASADILTATQETQSNLIVVGQYGSNSRAKQILDQHLLSDPFSADPSFVQEQGYVVSVYPDELAAGKKVYLASGWGQIGSVYAISHLRTHLQASNGELYLDVESSPSDWSSHEELFRPDLAERAIYYNIAYGISYGALTPDNWTDAQWRYWIDQLVCAQLTHVYFFLWGDLEVYFPPSNICRTERNRILHERLQNMIEYAHLRGLKVTYLFSPSIVPKDIFEANKDLIKATINYVDHGYPVVCQAVPDTFSFGTYSWAGVMDFMIDVYENEIEWFKEADEFHLWFYDPGGCFCDSSHYDCRGHQAERLMEQVETFVPIIWNKNPEARIGISTWPIWVLEPEYGVSYRGAFLDALKTWFLSDMDRVTVVDANDHPDTCLIAARARGFRLNGFVYQTNVETGYPFLIPMLDYLESHARISLVREVDALYAMRIEEGSKFPNTYFASRYFWNRGLTQNEVVNSYSRWVANSDLLAANELLQALLLLDSFSNDGSAGQDLEAKGAEIRQRVEGALQRLDLAKQNQLEWLLTTAKAMEILGEAVEHQNDPQRVEQLRNQFVALMQGSEAFQGFAPVASWKFDEILPWLDRGWWAGRF